MLSLFFSAMCLIASLVIVLTEMNVFVKGILLIILAVLAWVMREGVGEDHTADTLANVETIFSGVCGVLYVFAGVLNVLIFGF